MLAASSRGCHEVATRMLYEETAPVEFQLYAVNTLRCVVSSNVTVAMLQRTAQSSFHVITDTTDDVVHINR